MGFYELMFNQNNPTEAIKRYVGEVYIQHNPAVANDKEAFIEYFVKMAEDIPVNELSSSELLQKEIMWSCTAIRSSPVMKVLGLELTFFD